ncbi:hypothetical protein BKA62DRAFT_699563 [Auriculariales sp. MPI-PUGE-AT-0066]|nr:hypothetical protein BKA62DRAFT_699563 [Auriculariales sp. MPI-PUGE-AT-0066]
MATSSELYLPRQLPFPITIIEVHARVGDEVTRGTKLLTYSFRKQVKLDQPLESEQVGSSTNADAMLGEETRFSSWEAPIDGQIERWNVRPKDVLDARRAQQRSVISIQEPCTHGMQVNGLCALCGKDMTALDFTGYSDATRANIQMTHLASGPTVSLELAHKHERETAERLLRVRKLSLIVDLDQTIVHATVDPTVGKWIAESKEWDSRKASRVSKSPGGTPEPLLEENPNWAALRDVHQFILPHDLPYGYRSSRKGKEREQDGSLYYIKPRPGLTKFLTKMNEKYEMHVYTMGTRGYAEKVCAAIDPDGVFFRSRILSRDESGSLTAKSLQRLFPCDTSMVVIIDDRSDVWDNSPNLVNVDRYEFFKGSGDINATFLPPLPPTDPRLESIPESTNQPPHTTDLEDSEDDKDKLTDSLLQHQHDVLEAQIEARPLEKEQEKLDAAEAEAEKSSSDIGQPVHQTHHHHKAVLTNDDDELLRLEKILSQIHSRFFKLYAARRPGEEPLSSKENTFDATKIIPWVKAQTFSGMHFLFSSLIPLDAKHPEQIPIWAHAVEFGATVHTDFSPLLTHVVTAKRETAKVHTAHARGGTHIVWAKWLTDSVIKWAAQDVGKYLVFDDDREKYKQARSGSKSSSNSTSPTSGSAALHGSVRSRLNGSSQPVPTDVSADTASIPLETNSQVEAEQIARVEEESEEMQEPDSELPPVEFSWGDLTNEVDEYLDDDDDEDGVDYSQWDNMDASSEVDTPGGSQTGTRSPRGKKRGRSAESDGDSVGGKRPRRVSGLRIGVSASELDAASDRAESDGGGEMEALDDGSERNSAADDEDDEDFLALEFAKDQT